MSDEPAKSRWLFILLLLVAVASLAAIIYLHANQDLQWLVQVLSAPFVVALLGIVVQTLLWEQRKQHELLVQESAQKHEEILQEIRLQHEQFQQEREHALQLGAVSGIALRIFDGYVEFCREYLSALQKISSGIVEQGCVVDLRAQAEVLREIRLSNANSVWVPQDIDGLLAKLEQLLAEVEQTKDQLGRTDPKPGYGMLWATQAEWLKMKLRELRGQSNDPNQDKIVIAEIIRKIKEVLEIDTLTQLRRSLIQDATSLHTEDDMDSS